ncbi:MAG: penicillin-binding protein [Caldibacillus debilis]|uniref:Penicillin-binding protein n=2 Tax=Caldibacillus debilis TaxID=301148 RepID=A0A3E0K1N9_9BACI|nr:penicillin-binding protein 1A [Caldibacillus debilis]REJ26876.1 MAG: penicillin-binding protein [Caldibacillus debilis]
MSEQYKSRVERKKIKRKKRSAKKDIAKKVFLTCLLACFFCLVAGVSAFAIMVSDAPKLDPEKLKDPVSSQIYDMNNDLITEVGIQKRDYVPFEEIPDLVKNAILATEDVRFFKHHGIDLIRLGGAVISNITDGFGSQGASTLTQQVVKMSYLSNEKTIKRKVQEAWLAFQLEQNLSKEEIFEIYVNKIPMGGNIYGIKTAANTYFGKDLDELTLPEAALIAGLPQRPNAYNPFVNPDLADKRKNTVLSLMHQHGFISEKEMKEAQKVKVKDLIVKEQENIKDDSPYQSFIDRVIDEVEKMGYNVYTDGLKIYTTMDPKAQEYVHTLLNTDKIIAFPNDKIQSGVVLLDTKTGEIRAIGGGRHQKVLRGLNYATDIRRQPGSTIKPILDYGPAIEYLKWSTAQIFEDKPHTYSDGTKVNNFGNRYYGNVTMRFALQKSLNIPAVKALQTVGLEKARSFAVNLGIPLEDTIYESYAIGGMKKGIAPIHLAGAYSAFGNNGVYNEPHAVKKIVLSDGETEIKPNIVSKVAMSDYTAFMITDMLKTVMRAGTGYEANVPGIPLAGKTGTTNYTDEELRKYGLDDRFVPDSWMGGYSTNYTAAVWVGYEKKKDGLSRAEQLLAKQIFKNLMAYVHQGIDTPDFTQPKSVVRLGVVRGTNPPQLAGPFTPSSQIIYEYFVKGYEPKEVSDQISEIPAPENLKARFNEKENSITLQWKAKKAEGLAFEVYVSENGGAPQLLKTTDERGLVIENVTPGVKYTFTVYAVYEGMKSRPASVTVDLTAYSDEKQPGLPENGNGQPNGGQNGSDDDDEASEEQPQDDGGDDNSQGNDQGGGGQNNGGNGNGQGGNGGNNGGSGSSGSGGNGGNGGNSSEGRNGGLNNQNSRNFTTPAGENGAD